MRLWTTVACGLVWLAWSASGFAQENKAFKQSEKNFEGALETGKEEDLKRTVESLVAYDSADAVRVLTRALKDLKKEKKSEKVYWIIVRGIGMFRGAPALDAILAWILDNRKEDAAIDILFMMENNESPELVSFFGQLAKRSTEEMQVMAVDQLASRNDARAVPVLVEVLKSAPANSALRRQTVRALEAITKQSFGEDATKWEGWTAGNAEKIKVAPPPPSGGDEGGGTVVEDPARDYDYGNVKKVPKDAVVVIKADCPCGRGDHNLDHIEQALSRIGIPHIVVTKQEFEDKKFTMDDRMAVLVNCNQWREHCFCKKCVPGGSPNMRLLQCTNCNEHDPKTSMLSDAGVKKIKKFVEGGGYLFCEDWDLEEILERGFPGYVIHDDYMEDDTVNVLPAQGTGSHPYMKKIFGQKRAAPVGGDGGTVADGFKEIGHEWKIDKDSPTIKVQNAKEVVVLLESPKLGKSYGESAVAVTFAPGGKDYVASGPAETVSGGRVLHVLSHFGKQKSQDDEYTLENLLMNFLIEGTRRYSQGEIGAKK